MIIKTDYGEYDDDDLDSMLNYCCRIRGNPEDLMDRTIMEFGGFVELAIWGGTIGELSESREVRDEAFRIYHTYRGWVRDDEPAVVFWGRMFVDYCTKEYCYD